MKIRIIHPLWVHLPAIVALAIAIVTIPLCVYFAQRRLKYRDI